MMTYKEAARVCVAPQALEHAQTRVLPTAQHARKRICQLVLRGRVLGPQPDLHLYILRSQPPAGEQH